MRDMTRIAHIAHRRGGGADANQPRDREAVFRDFIATHGRSYATHAEYMDRLASFAANMDRIDTLNSAAPMKGHTATYGVRARAHAHTHSTAQTFTHTHTHTHIVHTHTHTHTHTHILIDTRFCSPACVCALMLADQ
jgi:hypothetical protein